MVNSIEEKVQLFEDFILCGLNNIAPEKNIKLHSNDAPWMTAELKSQIKKRQKAFALGNRPVFAYYRNLVNRNRKRCRQKYYHSKIEQLKSSKPKRWWAEVKKICGHSPLSVTDISSTLNSVTGLADLPPNEVAKLINDTFLEPQLNYEPLSISDKINIEHEETPIQVSEYDTFIKLKRLNANKSPGPDQIAPWLLKHFAEILAYPVSLLLNRSLTTGKVPLQWKRANITPLPKTSQVTDLHKHLRPISLTSAVSKIAEEFVLERELKEAILKIIDPCQFGVVPKSSTTLNLIAMLHKWSSAADKPGTVIRTVLFDFRKAFDLIDHKTLVNKLVSLDLSIPTKNWIIDFLTNRTQRVKLQSGGVSEWSDIRAGVPQGTKLGPWLYALMINDLSSSSHETWKFVDDTSLSEMIDPGNQSHIQSSVDEIQAWTESNLAELNEEKCKELRIDFTRKTPSVDPFSPILINNKSIDIVDHAKILGLIVSKDMKWNKHIESVVSKASKRLNLITQLKRANVPEKDVIQIYCACIRSILEYAAPVFHDSLPQYLSMEIESVQKRCLKKIFPDTSYDEALGRAGLRTLYERRSNACEKLFMNAYTNCDHKLHDLVPSGSLCPYSLRTCNKLLIPNCRTDRFKNSFIIANSLKFNK